MVLILRERERHVDEQCVLLQLRYAEHVSGNRRQGKEPSFESKTQIAVFQADAIGAVGVGAIFSDALFCAVTERNGVGNAGFLTAAAVTWQEPVLSFR